MIEEDSVEYKGYHIVQAPEPYHPSLYMIMDGYDYFQVPPFRSIEDAKRYIDAGGKGVFGEKIPGWENRA